MSNPTAEILSMSYSNQENFLPSRQLPLHKFLPLAPTTSASYPASPPNKSASPSKATPKSPESAESGVAAEAKTRRSSSLSSDGSLSKKRFLKLGPVHFGEHADGGDGKGDWSEEVIV